MRIIRGKRLRWYRFAFTITLTAATSSTALQAEDLSLQALVTPSTVILKDGRPVRFAVHGFIEFKSLTELSAYIDAQTQRWKPDGLLASEGRRLLAREILRRGIESRVVSMVDERPLELLLTHTSGELRQAIDRVTEPIPPGYADAFLEVQEKWKHSLNCWSASPSISGRVLSNWYPIEEGIQLYDATYDSTEHFWQAVKYHPDVTVTQLNELLDEFEHKNWTPWLAALDDRELYLKNAYAVEFLRHNLKPERIRWFRDELARQGLQPGDHVRRVQQRDEAHGSKAFRFSAYEEKVLWDDLADLFHLVYRFSVGDGIHYSLSERHFDAVYLGERKLGFVSEEFRSLMFEIWKVKYLQMPRFREVIGSIPLETRLEHFLNDGDSPDIPIPVYVGYLNQIRKLARAADQHKPASARPKTVIPSSASCRSSSRLLLCVRLEAPAPRQLDFCRRWPRSSDR